jgi:phosphate-selective porin OprO and OprP
MIGLVLGVAPAAARAQQTNPGDVPPANQPIAGWNNGFFMQSPDGQNRLQISVMIHADGRFAPGEDTLVDTFAIRRGRASFRGRIADRFEFYFNPDFAGGVLTVQDAYVETRFASSFRVRLGKQKAPVGNERAHTITNLLFLERALPTALTPNRDVGIQVLGDIAGGRLTYGAALMNGVRDGASADLDTDNNKELDGRVVVRPFVRNASDPLSGLSVALSGSTSRQTTAQGLPAYRTTVFQQTFFSYAGATADGRLNRVSPYVSFYRKAFGGFAEVSRSSVPVTKGSVTERIAHRAWQAAASWVVTGETATEAGVQPKTAFNFGQGGWGALQVAVRYHTLSIDQAAFALGLAAGDASRKARAWSAGANWYLNRNVKYVFLFERTTFAGTLISNRPPETVVAFRTQLAF